MSMYQIEDLIEESVKVIDSAKDELFSDKRSIIYNLYVYQSLFDTSETMFRVTDILVKNHYLYEFPFEKFPNHEDYDDYATIAVKEEFVFIPENINLPLSDSNPPSGAIAHHDAAGTNIYVKAGTFAWRKLIKDSILTVADDIAEPKVIDQTEMTYQMMLLALKQDNKELARDWRTYGLLEASNEDQNNETLLKIEGLATEHNL